MKILLTTLNSKYVHSNLALKYLYTVAASEYSDVEVREFTINHEPGYIYTEIIRANYDMVCFSTYIWNIEQIKALCSDLKKARPKMIICLGGPEVSYCGKEFMEENPWADLVLRGEGEYSFYRLCQVLCDNGGKAINTVPGLMFKTGGKIYENPLISPMNFSSIPFPYSVLDCREDQVVYYESSRGCPFGCSYCLSAEDKMLRVLDMDRVKADLGYFIYKKVMQVKFIDRTFNYDRGRAYEIFKYLMENDNGVTNFHFEICADLLDPQTLNLISHARQGLFQFEIGIQSTNPDTLTAINRKENIYPLLYNVEQLVKMGNIHIHVDLIAGLPYETYEIFQRSFNKVYALQADALQLGFLKVLKGTPIYRQIEEHGIIYRDKAPYEVISTKYISAGELARLHMVESVLDIYYNRGGFKHTLKYMIDALGKGVFGFYEALAAFYYEEGYQHRPRKKEDNYRIMYQFAVRLDEVGRSRQIKELEDFAVRVKTCLQMDMSETLKPEECRRFEKKGWEVTK